MKEQLRIRGLRALLMATFFSIITIACSDDDKPKTAPELTTAEITEITATTAMGGGTITDDGNVDITASGLCYSSTNEIPTTADDTTNVAVAQGSFVSLLDELESSTTYYVRAYATNSIGTNYGEVKTFTTSDETVSFTYNEESVTYGVIKSSVTGRKWLDRNLGAPAVASAYNDYANYGDLFQWGRADDGHQLMNRASTNEGTTGVNGIENTLASSSSPGHAKYISAPDAPYDWLSPQNDNLWQGVDGVNNPCPSGWHIPTKAEWNAENLTNLQVAFTKLKLTAGGTRPFASNGVFENINNGCYWTSTVSVDLPIGVDYLVFGGVNGNVVFNVDGRASANSCRCIKD